MKRARTETVLGPGSPSICSPAKRPATDDCPPSPTFLPSFGPDDDTRDAPPSPRPLNPPLTRRAIPPTTRRATKVTFGLLSAETILNGSVCPILTPRTHLRGDALANGLFDPRMGPPKAGEVCVTCNREYSQCPGHSAHLTLALPVFNAELIAVVVKVLRSVCFHCSRLLLRHPQYENKLATLSQVSAKKDRLNAVATASKTVVRCGDSTDRPNLDGRPCGGAQVRYTHIKKDCTILVQPLGQGHEQDHAGARPIRTCTPFKIHSILRHICDQDISFLGLSPQYSHPRNMMWSVLYIPPPIIRPGRTDRDQQPNARSENDLTKRLKSIVRCNQLVAKHMLQAPVSDHAVLGTATATSQQTPPLLSVSARHAMSTPNLMVKEAPTDALSRAYRDLQIAIGSYQNNATVLKGGGQYGKMPDSVRNRYQGPGGAKRYRVRGTVLSVRENQAARGVIVPSATGEPNTIGVPQWMCMRMTYPERMTAFNRSRLEAAVTRGPDQYPGAQYAISPSGTMYDLRAKQRPPISLGWTIRRHLVEGDHVLANRQPSLHKQSILGLKIKVVQSGDAIHVPPLLCQSFAADYDGDEMNLYPCQSDEASAECELLAGTAENMLKDGKPIVAFMQHSALFFYKVTIRQGLATLIRRSQVHVALHLFMEGASCDPYRTGVAMLDHPSTRAALSKPSMDGFEFISLFLPKDLVVHVEGLDIVGGSIQSKEHPITQKLLNHGLLLTLCRDYGTSTALKYLGGMYRVANYMLDTIGCSISYDDCVPSVTDMHEPRVRASGFIKDVETTLGALDKDLLPSVETIVIDCVDAARESLAQAAVASLRSKARAGENGFLDIIDSQTKGSPANLSSISAALGQQLTIAHERQDLGLEGSSAQGVALRRLGYIDRSFVTGLTSIQYFQHLAAARSSVVNMSVQTACTGYIARKLCIFMQDMNVTSGGCVRSESGHIVQFKYADDGFSTDGERVSIGFASMDLRRTFAHYWFMEGEGVSTSARAHPPSSDYAHAVSARVDAEAELGRILRLQEIFKKGSVPAFYSAPVNFARLLERSMAHRARADCSPVTPGHARELISEAWGRLCGLTQGRPCLLLAATFWDHWTRRNICNTWGLDESALRWAINCMCVAIHRATVPAGSPVGTIAAQYTTEPMTQANLSSTHSAGQGPMSSGGVAPTVSRLISFSSSPVADHLTRLKLRAGELPTAFASSIVRRRVKDYVLGVEESLESSVPGTMSHVHLCTPPVMVVLTLDRRGMIQADLLPADLFREMERFLSDAESPIAHVELLPTSTLGEHDATWVMCIRYVSHMRWDVDEDDQGDPGHYNSVYGTLGTIEFGGLTGIEACTVQGGDFDVCVHGNNLVGLLCDPRVIARSIRSSDIGSIFQVLGIDAAVAAICTEWTRVLKDVSYKHVRLIADAMCCRGVPVPVSSRGLMGAPVMKLASFEKSVDNIVAGALFGAGDSHTTSTATYCGALCWNGVLTGVGTGAVNVVEEVYALPMRLSEPLGEAEIEYDSGYRGRSYADTYHDEDAVGVRPTRQSAHAMRVARRLSDGVVPFSPWMPPSPSS